ncbi:ABC transporter permease [Rhodococcus rhodochrous]|uniref:ABC transporter permease n=1 Tax=Rhodococcus TaxID=1827 RepID=UPI000AB700EF|nr:MULTISPECIES: ABC transporter permease [Rhodococcus]MDC3724767.1 ABC transporter permease [Rhodococcus sp. Rp3]MDO1483722.1 ABC transporter permease [Rhodococcus rhodochrous]WSE22903.1 ABC transporter permease [Rhodococcus sp. PD04]SNV08533.1 ABC transporter permease [Rhodococcus rhodochrous]
MGVSVTDVAIVRGATDARDANMSRTRPRFPAVRIRRAVNSLARFWLLALVLILWELVAQASSNVFFPPPSRIAEQFVDDWLAPTPSTAFLSEHFYATAMVSLKRLAAGWVLAAVIGIAVGVLLARSTVAARMYGPVVRFWLAVPNAILIPIAVKVFGVTDAMNIFMIAFGTVWLIIVNTADGVSTVDSSYLRSARSLHLGGVQLYSKVVIPAALPRITAGLRVSIGIGLILMIVSEFFATTAGLGYEVQLSQQTFQYTRMWSAFVLIAVIGLATNAAFAVVERRILHWQRREGLKEQ